MNPQRSLLLSGLTCRRRREAAAADQWWPGGTVDGTNPALPIVINIYHNSHSVGSLR